MATRGHLIVPLSQTVSLTPFHKLTRVEVNLDPEDAHYMSGFGDNADYLLSKNQIETLGAPMNISLIDSRRDPEEKRDNVLAWQITAVLEQGGKRREVTRTYELDLRLQEIDGVDGSYIKFAMSRVKEKADKARRDPTTRKDWMNMPPNDAPEAEWNKWIREQALKDWSMTNRHRVRRAETGASLAAMRLLMGIKSTYKKRDFEEPWIFVREEVDFERSMAYGGVVGELALRTLGAYFTRAMGLPDTMVSNLLEGISTGGEKKELGPPELFPADDDEINALVSTMQAAGFQNRAACDHRMMELFDIPLSQATKRHLRIMNEYVAISAMAKRNLDPEDFEYYKSTIRMVVQLAYAEGSSIHDTIEEDILNKIEGKQND